MNATTGKLVMIVFAFAISALNRLWGSNESNVCSIISSETNVECCVMGLIPKFVDVPTNKTIFGIELGSVRTDAQSCGVIPNDSDFRELFDCCQYTRALVSKRISSFKLEVRHNKYTADSCNLLSQQALHILTNKFGCSVSTIHAKAADVVQMEIDDAIKHFKDIPVTAIYWRASLPVGGAVGKPPINLEFRVNVFTNFSDVAILHIIDPEWENVRFFEQQLASFMEDQSPETAYHDYFVPPSLLRQRNLNFPWRAFAFCDFGVSEVYSEELKIDTMRFSRLEYRDYLQLILEINELLREIELSFQYEKARRDKFHKIADVNMKIEDRILGWMQTNFIQNVILLTNSLAASASKSIERSTIDRLSKSWRICKLDDYDDWHEVSNYLSLICACLSAYQNYGLSNETSNEDRVQIESFIFLCSTWRDINRVNGDLVNECESQFTKWRGKMNEFKKRFAEFVALVQKASSRESTPMKGLVHVYGNMY